MVEWNRYWLMSKINNIGPYTTPTGNGTFLVGR